MVIGGIVEGGVFCHDMGDVQISGVSGNITVKYQVSGPDMDSASFDEVYYPDKDGNVKIHGLGDVALSYFRDLDINLLHTTDDYTSIRYYVMISGSIYNDAGEQAGSFTQTFYYSNCRTGMSAYDKRFLSRFSKRMVRVDQVVPVAYHKMGQTLVLGIAYKSQDKARFHKVNFFSNTAPGTFDIRYFSVPAIVERLNKELGVSYTADDIIFYEASLYSQEVLIDKIHFDIDRRHYPQITHFVFYNCFGFPESLYFTGRDERSSELTASFGSVKGEYLKLHTDLITSHTANTGYINDTIRDCVEDMVHSTKVYLYKNDVLGDLITITEVDFTESKPRTEPLNIKLTYRVANECQRIFARDSLRERIFDKTFDSTFD